MCPTATRHATARIAAGTRLMNTSTLPLSPHRQFTGASTPVVYQKFAECLPRDHRSFTAGSNTALAGRFAPFAKRPDKEGGFTMSMQSTSPQLPRRQFLRKAVTAAGAA